MVLLLRGLPLWTATLITVLLIPHTVAKTHDHHHHHHHHKSLCGENEKLHSGTLNDLFYVLSTPPTSSTTAPLILWLSGGPGCSGLVGMLFENGPCSIGETSSSPTVNKFSWTNAPANILYVDQPIGTGFSSPIINNSQVWKEQSAMERLHDFVLMFFKVHPSFASSDFYIFGESYGGHYVPDLASLLLRNSNVKLRGIGVGNGLISPLDNFETLVKIGNENTYGIKLLSSTAVENIASLINSCKASTLTSGNESFEDCNDAFSGFNAVIDGAGTNHYDIRKPCHEDPSHLCYRFKYLHKFVNSKHAKRVLNVTTNSVKRWEVCASEVLELRRSIDWYAQSSSKIPHLLENGVKVLIYAGDADLVCNWYGQDQWTRRLEWKYASEFNAAKVKNWKTFGTVHSSHGLTFLRVFNSGHMVPHDQPQVALEMLKNFIHKSFDS